ncbi:MAG: ATP-binding cassette domain-containing protein [Ruminococcaceae bacterium]|nr:ATP-binding cassette domain-containing protein [Oscillospiraceae bacterium]
MECIKVEHLSFRYPARSENALKEITFTVNQGEFVLLCGRSGCGKTTLLRLLKSSLAPVGAKSGQIYFDGKSLAEHDAKEQAARIGFVMQACDNQIVTDKVWHELAFGLESLGYKQTEIRTRVSEMASFFGIHSWFHKKTTELSGGQKQILSLASVMAMEPSVLLLDEPTSQLDPIAAGEFLRVLEKINRELGVTVILTEHRLEDTFTMADRVIVMDGGAIIADAAPREVGGFLQDSNHALYKALPTPMRVHASVANSLPCPLTVREGRDWLCDYAKENTLHSEGIPRDKVQDETDVVLEAKEAWFRYEKNMPDVLRGFTMSVRRGELFCMVGANGSGKTSALSLMAGLNRPYRGDVLIQGQSISEIRNLYSGLLGVLPQNPQSVFTKKTVYLDLMEVLSETELSRKEQERKVKAVSVLCHIENLLESHPYDLSGGEQQRAALAKVLLSRPALLLLDEPTKGMDAQFKEEFADILMDLKAKGVTIFMVSHDIEFCAAYADRCALVFDGSITSVDTPRAFFKGNKFYTTAANRMARPCLPDAVLAEDIILACGGCIEKKERQIGREEKPKKAEDSPLPSERCIPVEPKPKKKRKLTKRTLWATLLILFLIPLTIYAGAVLLGNRKYYVVSLLVILETMIPFFLMFEGRKPKARELVVISVLCAIGAVGRAAFFMLPQFKPVVPLVIVAGIAFGGETGFLVGAVSGFVSNFFLGQGPWTPWQMFALGMIGFVAGILFKKGYLSKTRLSLCLFGFLASLLIYGGIMNPASIIMWQRVITKEMILAAYIAGLSFDVMHGLGTAFFLWFLSKPMLNKLERIKIKYGLIDG